MANFVQNREQKSILLHVTMEGQPAEQGHDLSAVQDIRLCVE